MQELVIIGGGYAFWEIHELISDINNVRPSYKVIGVLDDDPKLQGMTLNNVPVAGPIKDALLFGAHVKFVFAIGSFKTRIIRCEILAKLNISDSRFETLIHPSAKIFSTSSVGPGCIVHYGTVIFNHSRVEPFSIIAANCVIAVNNHIGRGALLGSSITTTTGVKIGSYSFIGSSTSIGEFIEVGPGAYIGMGSLLLKDIKPGVFVLGNPPKMIEKTEVPDNIVSEWEILKTTKQ